MAGGLWEKVWVPRPMKDGKKPRPILCLRLIVGHESTTDAEGEDAEPAPPMELAVVEEKNGVFVGIYPGEVLKINLFS